MRVYAEYSEQNCAVNFIAVLFSRAIVNLQIVSSFRRECYRLTAIGFGLISLTKQTLTR